MREENHSNLLKTFDSCTLSVGPAPAESRWGGPGRHAPLSNVEIQEKDRCVNCCYTGWLSS